MKSFLCVLLAAAAFGVAADPPAPSPGSPETPAAVDDETKPERWNFTFDGKPWQLVSADLNGTAVIRTYIPEGRSLADTEERLIAEYGSKGEPAKLFEEMKTGLAQLCPTLELAALSETENSVLVEWSCGGSSAQHALKKITSTEKGIFVLGYSRRGKMSAEQKATWLAILEAAEPQ